MRFAWMVWVAGCALAPQSTTFTDGTPCLDDDGGLGFVFSTCLSSSCDTLDSAVCTYDVTGDTVRVTAEAVVTSRGRVCTDDCGQARASCDGPALPESGTITTSSVDMDLADLASCNDTW